MGYRCDGANFGCTNDTCLMCAECGEAICADHRYYDANICKWLCYNCYLQKRVVNSE